MTHKEAIEYLELITVCDGEKINDAISMAIEALNLADRIKSTNHVCLHCKHNQSGDCETINALSCPFGDFEWVKE